MRYLSSWRYAVAALLLVGAVPAKAAPITFIFAFPDRTPAPLTISSGALDLTLSNSLGLDGNAMLLRNRLGGLALSDGASIGSIDLMFSAPVRLVSFAVTNAELDGDGGFFNLSQGSLSSLLNSTTSLGVFSFTNTTDVFAAGVPIHLLTGDLINGDTSDLEAWAINSIVVETIDAAPVPEPATLALLGAGLAGLGLARRRAKPA